MEAILQNRSLLQSQLECFFSEWHALGVVTDIGPTLVEFAGMVGLTIDKPVDAGNLNKIQKFNDINVYVHQLKNILLLLGSNDKFGTWTRKFMELYLDMLMRAFAKADKHQEPIRRHYYKGLIFIDFDDLHGLNEKYTTAEADKVMAAYMHIVRECTRGSRNRRRSKKSTANGERRSKLDLRNFPDFIAQIHSGDEFVIVLNRVSSLKDLKVVASRIQRRLDSPDAFVVLKDKRGVSHKVPLRATTALRLLDLRNFRQCPSAFTDHIISAEVEIKEKKKQKGVVRGGKTPEIQRVA